MDTLRRTRTVTFLMAAAASVTVVAQEANTDWTQWRGPTRDGGTKQVITITQTKVVGVEFATWTEAVFSGNRIFVRDVNHLTLWTVS